MTQVNYVALIKSAKVASRDILRTEKVNALLGYISNVEAKITELKASVERNAKSLARSEYELRIATHFESPDLAEITKDVEGNRKDNADFVANVEKAIAEHNAKIAEYNDKIAKWHSGESKVDLERLNSLAEGMVREKIGTDFNMGLYKTAESTEVTS
jgi:hypothetical protein